MSGIGTEFDTDDPAEAPEGELIDCDECDGHGYYMVSAHGAQEVQCEKCHGRGCVAVQCTCGAAIRETVHGDVHLAGCPAMRAST